MIDELKANKGEWSEFYTLLKLLAEGKLYAADENLQKLKDIFYPVLKVITAKGTGKQIEYDLTEDESSVKVLNSQNGRFTAVNRSFITSRLENIFQVIKGSKETTFSINLAGELLEKLDCPKIQASTTHKSDVNLVVHDSYTGMNPEVGFSIKSQLGSPPTLLNSSHATNFIYELENFSGDILTINSIDTASKIRDRLKAINDSGGKLKFVGLQSTVYESNLRKIDSIMPDIVAEMLRIYYSGIAKTVGDITREMEVNGISQGLHFTPEKGFYGIKVKDFLMHSALSMMPSVPWDGNIEVHGGYIIVKKDGEIVCYHIYNMDQFKEYLFRNTKMETPSSSKHGFGTVYEEDGKFYIKLNLQIRFTD